MRLLQFSHAEKKLAGSLVVRGDMKGPITVQLGPAGTLTGRFVLPDGKPLADLVAAGEVYFEISMLEGVGGIANLLRQVPVHRVLFGSHAPLFYFESALLKLKESPLSEEQQRAIRRGNATRLLEKDR